MNLSLILLKSGDYLISQVDELDYEPRVHLTNPYLVSGKTKVTLTKWPLYTDDEHVLLNSDSLLTMSDPVEDILNKYLIKVNKTIEDFQPKDDRVLLNEEEQVPGPVPDEPDADEPDEYEPRYIEEPLY